MSERGVTGDASAEARSSTLSDRHLALCTALKQARQRAHLSQRQLAKRLGRAHSFVAKIEAGDRHVKVIELYDLAVALGVDSRELLREVIG